jgi:hypothetical protein
MIFESILLATGLAFVFPHWHLTGSHQFSPILIVIRFHTDYGQPAGTLLIQPPDVLFGSIANALLGPSTELD